jgi:hypothetical protein
MRATFLRPVRPAFALGLALGPALALVAQAAPVRHEAAGLRFAVPGDWTRVPAPSDMRAAQYRIPRAEGDPDDGEIVLFFFGPNRGGGVEENLNRWYGQFTQPDGKASKDVAVKTTRKVRDLDVTLVDLSGTYAGMGPGAAPAPNRRMLAAIVEGKGGPWFWKAIGPAATIETAKAGFDQLIDSLELHR